jgi:hypothetical protein
LSAPVVAYSRPALVRVGRQDPAVGVQGAVEQHALDPLVVVEVFDVPQVGHRHARPRVQVGGAVPGDLEVMPRRQGTGAQKLGDAAAPGHVQLQAVHRARVDEARRVGQGPAVLARRDVGHDRLPHRGEPGEVLGGHRFLEPAHPVRGHQVGDAHRLPGGVAAVGVHVEFGVRPDHLAGERHASQIAAHVAAPALTDLDLHPRNVILLHPAGQLVAGLAVVVAGETAAPVDGHADGGQAEQPGHRAAEQPRLEIPQGDVHGGYRSRGDPGPADVAYRMCHGFSGTRHVQRAAPGDRIRQYVGDDVLGGGGRVGPANAPGRPGSDGHNHHRGLVPGQCPVRFRSLGWDHIDRGRDLPHGRPVIAHGSPPLS